MKCLIQSLANTLPAKEGIVGILLPVLVQISLLTVGVLDDGKEAKYYGTIFISHFGNIAGC